MDREIGFTEEDAKSFKSLIEEEIKTEERRLLRLSEEYDNYVCNRVPFLIHTVAYEIEKSKKMLEYLHSQAELYI